MYMISKCYMATTLLPTPTPTPILLYRYSASLADEMDGEDVRRKVHISSVAGRSTSPDQQIEVKITTKKAAAYPVDSTTRK